MKKVYIEYQFRNGPYGGANQFLKNLKNYFIKNNLYTDNPEEADFILINHTNISNKIFEVKKIYPKKIIVHRMDGPVSKHRKYTLALDKQAFLLDKLICSGTIFQSKWTKDNCMDLGYKITGLTKVIHNAPNPDFFSRKKRIDKLENVKKGKSKISLICTSWSPNWNKGFDVLEYLDKHLNFEKYKFTFVGRSPIQFNNIAMLPALESKALANELKKHDIFIAVSKSESCSNSLIEAINSGLPVVARESGCYKEIIKDGGIVVKKKEEMTEAIEQVSQKLDVYSKLLPYYDIEEIGKEYYNFFLDIGNQIEFNKLGRKKCGFFKRCIWKISTVYIKIYIKLTDYYVNHIHK